MKRQHHLRQFVVVAIEVCDRNAEDTRQAHSHRVVRRMDTKLVPVDTSRGNELVQARVDPKLLLAQAERKPCFLETLSPDILR